MSQIIKIFSAVSIILMSTACISPPNPGQGEKNTQTIKSPQEENTVDPKAEALNREIEKQKQIGKARNNLRLALQNKDLILFHESLKIENYHFSKEESSINLPKGHVFTGSVTEIIIQTEWKEGLTALIDQNRISNDLMDMNNPSSILMLALTHASPEFCESLLKHPKIHLSPLTTKKLVDKSSKLALKLRQSQGFELSKEHLPNLSNLILQHWSSDSISLASDLVTRHPNYFNADKYTYLVTDLVFQFTSNNLNSENSKRSFLTLFKWAWSQCTNLFQIDQNYNNSPIMRLLFFNRKIEDQEFLEEILSIAFSRISIDEYGFFEDKSESPFLMLRSVRSLSKSPVKGYMDEHRLGREEEIKKAKSEIKILLSATLPLKQIKDKAFTEVGALLFGLGYSDELPGVDNLNAAIDEHKNTLLHKIIQWRVIFQWTDFGPAEVRIGDYH